MPRRELVATQAWSTTGESPSFCFQLASSTRLLTYDDPAAVAPVNTPAQRPQQSRSSRRRDAKRNRPDQLAASSLVSLSSLSRPTPTQSSGRRCRRRGPAYQVLDLGTPDNVDPALSKFDHLIIGAYTFRHYRRAYTLIQTSRSYLNDPRVRNAFGHKPTDHPGRLVSSFAHLCLVLPPTLIPAPKVLTVEDVATQLGRDEVVSYIIRTRLHWIMKQVNFLRVFPVTPDALPEPCIQTKKTLILFHDTRKDIPIPSADNRCFVHIDELADHLSAGGSV